MGQLTDFLHKIGFIMWVGSAWSLLQVLCVHGKAGTNETLTAVERKIAMLMDLGATLAMLAGIGLLLVTRDAGPAWAMKQGWFHAKLLAVVIFIGLHGALRVKVKRFRLGQVAPLPGWLAPLLWLLPVAIAALAVFRPF